MIGQVNHGISIACSHVIDAQSTSGTRRIRHLYLKIARIAFFPIGTKIAELQSFAMLSLNNPGFPNHLTKAPGPTVKMIASVVGRQIIADPIEFELRPFNAIGMPPHQYTEG